jgi:hypothetical protein
LEEGADSSWDEIPDIPDDHARAGFLAEFPYSLDRLSIIGVRRGGLGRIHYYY